MRRLAVHPLSAHYPSLCGKEELLLEERYESEGQEGPESESERDSSPIQRPRLQPPETGNAPPEAPHSPDARNSTSETGAEEGISQIALEELALLLTSTGESSEYCHGENGAEELAVELQNYMYILHDAADENWAREKEGYVCILMEAVLEGFDAEDEGVRIDFAASAQKRAFCDEEGVRRYDGSKRRRIVGDEKYLTGRKAGWV
ncbi:hypothetical protein C7212DRAFT_342425 [Tuber magnatum]|uniref:Uncharacterized protein n=1 Tax=Tuber magnatum TaxID=42249 RepID=A0A317SUJ6_9PEZI|nr:hypothetical protein C7212DRAFT_342425 [Tuber magnatum]